MPFPVPICMTTATHSCSYVHDHCNSMYFTSGRLPHWLLAIRVTDKSRHVRGLLCDRGRSTPVYLQRFCSLVSWRSFWRVCIKYFSWGYTHFALHLVFNCLRVRTALFPYSSHPPASYVICDLSLWPALHR